MHNLGKLSYCLGLAYSSTAIHDAYLTFSIWLPPKNTLIFFTIPASTIRYVIVGPNLSSQIQGWLLEIVL